MRTTFEQIAILGATGPTGQALAAEWTARRARVRVVGRSRERLARTFGDAALGRVEADLRDLASTQRAVEGCDLVFDCVGLPMNRMHEHGVTARNIAAAVQASGARCVQISSYWPYMPIRRLPLTEDHPRAGGPLPARARREAEDILQRAGAAILNLPDFYGPHVHTSVLNRALEEAAAGKTVNWIGSRRTPREHIYVPDAMKVASEVALRDASYGQRWIVPGAGPLSLEDIVRIAEDQLGRTIRVRTAGPIVLFFGSLLSADLRALRPVIPAYLSPLSFDGTRLRGLIGDIPQTPYETGIGRTLAWLTGIRGKSEAVAGR